MTIGPDNTYDKIPIALLRGKEGKMNRQIISHLSTQGPSTIYSITAEIAKNSENKIHYSTINRRIHDLEARNYVEKYGKVETKAGAETVDYVTTMRGDFAALALEFTPTDQRRFLANAGRRKNSPIMLLEFMMEKGLDDLVGDIIAHLAMAVSAKYIDLEQPFEGIIGAGFASVLGYRLRYVLLHRSNKELEGLLEILQYLIFRSSVLSVQMNNHNDPFFPPESDILEEVKLASERKDFQELFAPNFEYQGRSSNSQYMWIYKLYNDLLKIRNTRKSL